MRTRVAILAGIAATLLTGPSLGDECRASGKADVGRGACRPPVKLEPYDPDRVKSGRNPGFVDLGNGTELRVGGRARFDYDVRR